MISPKVDISRKHKGNLNENKKNVAKRSFDNAFKKEQISSQPKRFNIQKSKEMQAQKESSSGSESTNDASTTDENESCNKKKSMKSTMKKISTSINQNIANKGNTPMAEPSHHQVPLRTDASSHILLLNFDLLKERELRGFLTKRGVNPDNVTCITKPVALVSVDNEDMKAALLSCAGVPYKSKKLAALLVSGDVSGVVSESSDDMQCVFVSMLQKSLKKEDIVNIIGFRPKDIHLLTSGPKNTRYNACFIECSNPLEANHVVDVLNGRSESGVTIRAILRHKPRTKFMPVTETSLVVDNFPFTSSVNDVREEFPTAISIESARKGQFHLNFKTKEAREEAAATVPKKQMGGRRLRIVAITARENVLTVLNIPFNAEVDDVKALYPIAIKVSLCKRKNGKPNGSALVYFGSSDALQAALNETATKRLQGRQLRALVQGQESQHSDQLNATRQEVGMKETSKASSDRTASDFKKKDLHEKESHSNTKNEHQKLSNVICDKNKASKRPARFEPSSDDESESNQDELNYKSKLNAPNAKSQVFSKLTKKVYPDIAKKPVVPARDLGGEGEDSSEDGSKEEAFHVVPNLKKKEKSKIKPIFGIKNKDIIHVTNLPIQVGSDSEYEEDSEQEEKEKTMKTTPIVGGRNRIALHEAVKPLQSDSDSENEDDNSEEEIERKISSKQKSLKVKPTLFKGKVDKMKSNKNAVGLSMEVGDDSEDGSDTEMMEVAPKKKKEKRFSSNLTSMGTSFKEKHHSNKGERFSSTPGKALKHGSSGGGFNTKWKNGS